MDEFIQAQLNLYSIFHIMANSVRNKSQANEVLNVVEEILNPESEYSEH